MEREQVNAERKKRKGGKAGGQALIKTELQSLKKKLGKNKCKIAALKTKVAEKKAKDDDVDFEKVTCNEEVDAGDSFSGKRSKKKKD